ncbi:hypothetical protein H0H92_009700 [Tricholoma furcatifolium]|nr:hypothetical protein H0H92_009700 [Tricholoma furcatifolium]
MYGSTRRMLALFNKPLFQTFMTLGEALAMGLVFGLPQKTIGTNEPFPGVFICADADPADGTHWVVYYWIAILIIESICLSLALYKAWQHRASQRGSPLMQELTRDSAIYFATLVTQITLDELGTAFAFVMSSIFANRLLITVRSSHYRTLNSEVDTYLPSVRFVKGGPDDTLNNTVELTTFNDRTGV